MTGPRLGAVIVAAGAGARLGGVAKALLPVDRSTFLARIAATLGEVGAREVVVVVGPPHGDAVADEARRLGLAVVDNAEPDRGMASSVALGFAALAARDVEAAWLWPVDHPDVAATTLRALVDALGPHEVAQPRHRGRGGHPPLIARALWSALAACGTRDGGARAVLAAADRVTLELGDPGVVRDVDTPADLQRRSSS